VTHARKPWLILGLGLALAAQSAAQDCNQNGTDDLEEIALGALLDCSGDGIPDSCQVPPVIEDDFEVMSGGYVLVNDAQVVNGVAELTPAASSTWGNLNWLELVRVGDTRLIIDFRVQIANGTADVISLWFMNADNFNPQTNDWAWTGDDLYLEFDHFYNWDNMPPDPNGNHVEFGTYPWSPISYYTPSFSLEDGQWIDVSIDLDGDLMTVSLGHSGKAMEPAFTQLQIPGLVPHDVYLRLTSTNGWGAPGAAHRLDDFRVIDLGPGAVECRAPLLENATSLSLDTGGTISFDLDAGPELAFKPYLLLGSASGTTPGYDGTVHVPLNADSYMWATVFNPNTFIQNSLFYLDQSGRGAASMTLPGGALTSLAGVELHHAYLVFDDFPSVGLVSNPVPLTLEP